MHELAQRDGVEVTGYVDSMADALNRAAVAVAPMVSGSGIQNKILEALACALPVVTTTIGRGGIPAGEANGVFVADDAAAVADATAALLQDTTRAGEAGRLGREFVLERYTWARNAEAIERIYEEVSANVARETG